ncbi:MAG: hypothetical protein B6I23_02345 [Rickettsiaceae bacterium 4572_127]|nr:MAG: hypothetical protein B6I23_02345 [Rickettsiaceae bacterium 4572_127]
MKKLFNLFVIFTVFFAFTMPIDARRSTRRDTDTETSNRRTNARSGRSSGARSSRTNTRSGRSTNARAGRSSGRSGSSRSARTANLAVSSTSTESVATETPTDTPAVEEPAKDLSKYAIDLDALNAGANSIKQCQSKMLECAKNTIPSDDKKSVQLGLCKANSKRTSFREKEKALRGIERKLFSAMGEKGKAKSWDEEQEESVVDSMNRMQEEMDAMDDAFAGNNKSATPKALFENIFKSCHAIVDTCESVIGKESMRMYIKGMSEDACNKYDNNLESKYNKQVLMYNATVGKTKLAYMKNRRKNMISTEEGFAKIQETLESTVCGKGMKDCLYCGENQTNETACINDLTSKMASYKATVQDTLDAISYGDNARGDGIWTAYLEKAKNKITEFARMSNYSAKENATKGLKTAVDSHKKEIVSCLKGIGGEDLIAFASPDKLKAGFGSLQGAKPITYKIINAEGVEETKTMPLSDFSFDKIYDATVDITDSMGACGDYVDLLKNDLRLLNENPNVDKNLLPWNFADSKLKGKLKAQITSVDNSISRLRTKRAKKEVVQNWEEYKDNLRLQVKTIAEKETKLEVFADDIFIKIVKAFEAKANNNLQENRGQLMDQQLAFLAKKVEGYEANRGAELAISNADKETAIQMREKDSTVRNRDAQIAMDNAKKDSDQIVAGHENDTANDNAATANIVAEHNNDTLEDNAATTNTVAEHGNDTLEDNAATTNTVAENNNSTTEENSKEVEVCYYGKKATGKEGKIGCKTFQVGNSFTCDKNQFGGSNSYTYYRKCKIGSNAVAKRGEDYTIKAGDISQ